MIGLGLSIVGGAAAEASSQGNRNVPAFSNTKSLSFDGVNDLMQFSSNPTTTFQSLLGASSFTISYWVKAADIVNSGNGNVVTLAAGVAIISGTTLLTLGRFYGNHSDASYANKVEFRLTNTSSGDYFNTFADHSGVTLSDDTWIHVAYTSTIDGSSRVGKVYINGSVLPTSSDSSTISGGDFSSFSLGGFGIGATFFETGAGTAFTVFSEVSLDEIAFFDTALNASQVSDIYNSGVPRDELAVHGSRLVGYWRLEDNGTDGSANSNDFTITGATFSTSVPT